MINDNFINVITKLNEYQRTDFGEYAKDFSGLTVMSGTDYLNIIKAMAKNESVTDILDLVKILGDRDIFIISNLNEVKDWSTVLKYSDSPQVDSNGKIHVNIRYYLYDSSIDYVEGSYGDKLNKLLDIG